MAVSAPLEQRGWLGTVRGRKKKAETDQHVITKSPLTNQQRDGQRGHRATPLVITWRNNSLSLTCNRACMLQELPAEMISMFRCQAVECALCLIVVEKKEEKTMQD